MKTIAVYGSLKKGKHNHAILENSKFLGETTVKGTLYRVSSYPAITEEGDNEIDAEVYEVEENIYNSIRSMELGAGYKEVILDLDVVGTMSDGYVTKVPCIVYYADDRLKEYCINSNRVIESY